MKIDGFQICNLRSGRSFRVLDQNRWSFNSLKLLVSKVFILVMKTNELKIQLNSQNRNFSSLGWKPMKFLAIITALSVSYTARM